MSIGRITAKTRVIAIPLAENVGQGVELIDQGLGAPVIVNRPANDQGSPTQPLPANQLLPQAVGFEVSGATTSAPLIRVRFFSDAPGDAIVYLRVYVQSTASVGFWEFGSFVSTPRSFAQQMSLRTRLNGADATHINGSAAAAADAQTLRATWRGADSNNLNAFVPYTAVEGLNSNVAVEFPINAGENVLEISPSSNALLGEGAVIDSVCVKMLEGNGVPARGMDAPRVVKDYGAYGEPAVFANRGLEVIQAAKDRRSRVLLIGSSLAVNDLSYWVRTRERLIEQLGRGGLSQRGRVNGSSDTGSDLTQEAQWLQDPTQGLLLASSAGGVNEELGQTGLTRYLWGDGSTGHVELDVPADVSEVEVITRTETAGSNLTILDGSTVQTVVNTTGPDAVTYRNHKIAVTPGGTLRIEKNTAAGDAGLCGLISITDSGTGLIAGRITRSGAGAPEDLIPFRDQLESYIAACGFEVVILEPTNAVPASSGGTSDWRNQGSSLDVADLLRRLTPAGGQLLLLYNQPFQANTFTDSATSWDNIRISNSGEFSHEVFVFAREIVGLNTGYLDVPAAVGHNEFSPRVFDASGWAGQSDNGTTRTIFNSHMLGNGAEIVAGLLSDILLGGSAGSESAAPTVAQIRDHLHANPVAVESVSQAVETDTASRDASKADLSGLATTIVGEVSTAIAAAVAGLGRVKRTAVVTPACVERPEEGLTEAVVLIQTLDADQNPVAPDAPPTLSAQRPDGADASALFSAPVAVPGQTGLYSSTLTVVNATAVGGVTVSASADQGGTTYTDLNQVTIADAIAVDFTAADRLTLDQVLARAAAANTESGTAVTLLTSQGQQLNSIQQDTAEAAKVGPLIEDGAFTAAALAAAPTGGGGGGDATEAKQDQILSLVQDSLEIEPDRSRTYVPKRTGSSVGTAAAIAKRTDEQPRFYIDWNRMLGRGEKLGSVDTFGLEVGDSGVTVVAGSVEKAGAYTSFQLSGGTPSDTPHKIDAEVVSDTGAPLEAELLLTVIESQ